MKLWKKVVTGTMLAALALGLTGCGGNGAKKEEATPKQVTVYMGVVEQQALVLSKEFEKDTGIKVNFVRMSGGETLSRIRAEKASPKASIWYGGSADSYVVAKKEGLL